MAPILTLQMFEKRGTSWIIADSPWILNITQEELNSATSTEDRLEVKHEFEITSSSTLRLNITSNSDSPFGFQLLVVKLPYFVKFEVSCLKHY